MNNLKIVLSLIAVLGIGCDDKKDSVTDFIVTPSCVELGNCEEPPVTCPLNIDESNRGLLTVDCRPHPEPPICYGPDERPYGDDGISVRPLESTHNSLSDALTYAAPPIDLWCIPSSLSISLHLAEQIPENYRITIAGREFHNTCDYIDYPDVRPRPTDTVPRYDFADSSLAEISGEAAETANLSLAPPVWEDPRSRINHLNLYDYTPETLELSLEEIDCRNSDRARTLIKVSGYEVKYRESPTRPCSHCKPTKYGYAEIYQPRTEPPIQCLAVDRVCDQVRDADSARDYCVCRPILLDAVNSSDSL